MQKSGVLLVTPAADVVAVDVIEFHQTLRLNGRQVLVVPLALIVVVVLDLNKHLHVLRDWVRALSNCNNGGEVAGPANENGYKDSRGTG